MKFHVVPLVSHDTTRPPDKLTLPAFRPLGEASNTRQVSLNEQVSYRYSMDRSRPRLER